jgi:hypothetical protein
MGRDRVDYVGHTQGRLGRDDSNWQALFIGAGHEHSRVGGRKDPPPVRLLGCGDGDETGRSVAVAIDFYRSCVRGWHPSARPGGVEFGPIVSAKKGSASRGTPWAARYPSGRPPEHQGDGSLRAVERPCTVGSPSTRVRFGVACHVPPRHLPRHAAHEATATLAGTSAPAGTLATFPEGARRAEGVTRSTRWWEGWAPGASSSTHRTLSTQTTARSGGGDPALSCWR